MAKILSEHFHEKKTYVALAKAISAANQLTEKDKEPLDRRKLKKIVDGDQDLVLSIAELHALDRYLEPFGEGLAYNSLFLRANVLQTIADAGKPVTLLLGSKPIEDSRLNLDHWDVNALAEIQRGVSNFAPDVRFDIRDVLLHEDLKSARRSVNSGKWTDLLDDDHGPSLVCLGCNRATHAAEAMLSIMFDTDPFKDAPKTKAELPFHFVWPPDLDHVFPSAFRYTSDDISALDPKAAKIIEDKGASALEMGGVVHLDRLKQRKTSESYGVCVAQRRPGGQIWFVLAGVTGPATYAAARLAGKLALNLRPTRPGKATRPYWAAVRANVGRDLTRSFGNFLEVKDQEIVSGPHAWERRVGTDA
jgi:hypothetical protein